MTSEAEQGVIYALRECKEPELRVADGYVYIGRRFRERTKAGTQIIFQVERIKKRDLCDAKEFYNGGKYAQPKCRWTVVHREVMEEI